VTTLVSPGLNQPSGMAVDGSGNVYFSDTGNNAIKEIPNAFVGPASLTEPAAAGSDSLLQVLPATASLAGVFTPTSDQGWLTIGTIASGVVNFSFTANTSTSARAAHITELGQQITVTQSGLTPQTITFGALSNQSYGAAPFAVSATVSSGLTVGFNSQTTSVCTVSGTTVTLVAGGTCTIQATQGGNAIYAAAAPVNQGFQVTQESQTVTFGILASQALSTPPFTVSATASSHLTVSFKSATTSVCTISGNRVTLVALGTCTIHATQAGNADYAAATPVNRSFLVTPYGQTITFGALPSEPIGTAPFTVNATASSGLAVSFASITSAVCTVSGSTATLVAIGICTIRAMQAGNTEYAAATPVYRSFHVQATQTITFGALVNQPLSTPPFTISATASSGLTVKFYALTPQVCSISGTTLTLIVVGTCTIEATQPGNADYAAAAPVYESFQVTKGSQTITFGALANQPLNTPPFTVSATASSGLTVSFNSRTPRVCTVSGNTVTLVNTGICTIQATQAGNTNYKAAPPVDESFQVTP